MHVMYMYRFFILLRVKLVKQTGRRLLTSFLLLSRRSSLSCIKSERCLVFSRYVVCLFVCVSLAGNDRCSPEAHFISVCEAYFGRGMGTPQNTDSIGTAFF